MTELDRKLGLTPLSKKLEKEHWERVKKYKKRYLKRRVVYIGRTLPIDILCCIMYNMRQCIV